MKAKTNENSHRWIIAGVVAAMLLIFAGVMGLTSASADEYVVGLDVNPSIELVVDNNGKVKDVRAVNDDGEAILSALDVKGMDTQQAVAAVVTAMADNGYISEDMNSVLLSIQGLDVKDAAGLEKTLTAAISGALEEKNIDPAVVAQTIKVVNVGLKEISDKYGVSAGKANLMQKVASAVAATDLGVLKDLPVNDLLALINSADGDLSGAGSLITGTPNTSGYLTAEQALDAALKNMGLDKSKVIVPQTKFSVGDGTAAYDVEFVYNGKEYDFSVDARTGKTMTAAQLVEKLTSQIDGTAKKETAASVASTAVETASKAASGDVLGAVGTVVSAKNNADKAKAQEIAGYIGEDTAVTIALGSVGADKSSAGTVTAKMDSAEDGTPMYDIDFSIGGIEYGFAINGVTGDIVTGGAIK